MSNPPGHIGPSRGPLRCDQSGDVVERDDIANDNAFHFFRYDAHQEGSLLPAAVKLNLFLYQPIRMAAGLLQKIHHPRNGFVHRSSDQNIST